MDTMPDNEPMDDKKALDGLDPADLLRQGAEEDTIAGDGPSPGFTPPSPDELEPLFPEFELLGLIG